ncbi:MAG: hypothetical protein MIO92_16180 [Methanosarcinaceae archaeon]|nr:hypothetical protein [Methanosarcinaceae archaeon]
MADEEMEELMTLAFEVFSVNLQAALDSVFPFNINSLIIREREKYP